MDQNPTFLYFENTTRSSFWRSFHLRLSPKTTFAKHICFTNMVISWGPGGPQAWFRMHSLWNFADERKWDTSRACRALKKVPKFEKCKTMQYEMGLPPARSPERVVWGAAAPWKSWMRNIYVYIYVYICGPRWNNQFFNWHFLMGFDSAIHR